MPVPYPANSNETESRLANKKCDYCGRWGLPCTTCSGCGASIGELEVAAPVAVERWQHVQGVVSYATTSSEVALLSSYRRGMP